MNNSKILTILLLRSELLRKVALVLALGLMVCLAEVSEAAPMGTAFTYQGRLIDANTDADGLYDFQFKLFDANVAGSLIAGPVNEPNLPVDDGYFTTVLDFGSEVFDGNAVWLDIGVRPSDLNDPNPYTPLTPRTELTPVPYALHTRGVFVGNSNTFVGNSAGYYNTTGGGNTFVGKVAGASNTTGGNNTFLGSYTGRSNTTGNYNTFLGAVAGYSNETGYFNTFLGESAGYRNITGYYNTFLGAGAGGYNTTGYLNTFVGYRAGLNNTAGNWNTFLGNYAGFSNTTGTGNILIGYKAGYNETGSNKLYIANSDTITPLIYGDFSAGNVGIGTTSPDEKLTVAGTIKATNSDTTGRAVYGEASNTGNYMNYGGYFRARGKYGCGVHSRAYGQYGTGVYGFASDSGDYTNYGGYFEAYGRYGTGVHGRAHGNSGRSVYGLAYGSNGYGVYGEAIDPCATNYGGYFKAHGQYGYGVYGYGELYDFYAGGPGTNYGAPSSIRWKSDIRVINDPLEKVMNLRGVYFNWDAEHGAGHDVGMIAEEVGEVLPEIVEYEPDGKYTSGMDYSKLTPLLVEAVKALKIEVNELERQNTEKDGVIDTLKQQNDKLEGRLAAMESSIATITVQLKGGGK